MSRKYALTLVTMALVFLLIVACIFTGKDAAIVNSLITLLGSIVLFYMGGNVGEHFAVSKPVKKDDSKN